MSNDTAESNGFEHLANRIHWRICTGELLTCRSAWGPCCRAAQEVLADGWRKTEVISTEAEHWTAGRDYWGNIRLNRGRGRLVTNATATRDDVQGWLDSATAGRRQREYRAALDLINRENSIVVTFYPTDLNRTIPELLIPFADVTLIEADDFDACWPGDRTNWRAVLDRIEEHTRPVFGADRVDVDLFGTKERIHGSLVVDESNAGTFTASHPDQENS